MRQTIYFDDLGDERFSSASRTITEADVVNFAGVTGDFSAMHVDEIFAREQTIWGRRVAHGLLALAIGEALRNAIDDWHLLAFLECRRRFRSPVFIGDTIHAEYRIGERRVSRSKPDRGIVTLDVRLVNQEGEVVQDGQDVVLVGRRPGA